VDTLAGAVAWFDIGNTLASVVIAPSGDRIERLDVYPDVPSVLGELTGHGVRLGIISNRGTIPAENVNQALEAAGILHFFAPELIVYGRKDSPRIFEDGTRLATGAHLHGGGPVRHRPRGPLGRELPLPRGRAWTHPEARALARRRPRSPSARRRRRRCNPGSAGDSSRGTWNGTAVLGRPTAGAP
jgi:hypothetical protein